MGPLVGMLLGGGASGILGGAGGGGLMGGLMGSLMQGGGLSGLFSNLATLFGGGQQSKGAGDEQTQQLLGDIKNMLGELLERKEGGCGGASHGAEGGCGPKPMPPHGDPGCGAQEKPDCGAEKPECGSEPPECGGSAKPECGEADKPKKPVWDGRDKSPSLDREQGAARLLEQAKNTDDPQEKRELIDMALDMLGNGPKKGKGLFGKAIHEAALKHDGNSYDKDIVKQAHKMLDQIDEGNLSCSGESKALDSVIDMLMGEGGVDGKPATTDTNGNGRKDPYERMPFIHAHPLHHALFDDR